MMSNIGYHLAYLDSSGEGGVRLDMIKLSCHDPFAER